MTIEITRRDGQAFRFYVSTDSVTKALIGKQGKTDRLVLTSGDRTLVTTQPELKSMTPAAEFQIDRDNDHRVKVIGSLSEIERFQYVNLTDSNLA